MSEILFWDTVDTTDQTACLGTTTAHLLHDITQLC